MLNQRINKLMQMLGEHPEDLFLQYALGMEYQGMGQWPEARAAFEQVIEADEKYVPAYYQLAQLLIKMNVEDQAISLLEKGLLLAREQGDTKTASEFKSALDELLY